MPEHADADADANANAEADVDQRLRPPRGGWPIRVSTRTSHGRGVVTTRAVPAEGTCEVAPLMLLPAGAEWDGFDHVFDVGGRAGVAGGAVSFVNHSYTPNAAYDIDPEAGLVTLYALEALATGVEVLVNYNGDPSDDRPVWFDQA